MKITPQHLETYPVFYEGQHTRIYYQEAGKYGVPALIKVLKSEFPTPQQIVRFSNEFTLTHTLEVSGIRNAYDYGMIGRRHALLLRYVGGQTLKEAAPLAQWTLSEKLRIAVSIAQALSEVHQRNIIHKDINSRNILVELESLQTHIIDFGIASQVDLKTHHLGNPETLEGTLQYISPEQTGRMNRIVDYRTDLYSLGVTLYELFTGRLPFETPDVMELVHCHIARMPVPPRDVVETHDRASLPQTLSDILMKLLNKNAEDRYQSAHGVAVDLTKCLKQLSTPSAFCQEASFRIEPFELAQDDASGRFQLPQTLYGRNRQLKNLLRAFGRVSTQDSIELMLVAGYSGVGKSSLVHEVHKPITAQRGYFITGKFDQYQRNVPYYALQQAFDEFATYLLTESDERLRAWKERILRAVGNNGQVLLDMVPKLAFVIGEQPAVAEVGPQESRNRFNMVFQNFVSAITGPKHPLALFLDDLQWADSASLDLLKVLLTDPDVGSCLIIFAYRDNEVDASHPFKLALNHLKKAETSIHSMQVKNLSQADVNTLLADTFATEQHIVEPLTELLYQKTYGNAFFTTRLLQSFVKEGAIRFDHSRRQWIWDVDNIQKKGVTDNVAELMERKIGKLQKTTQEILKLAACIGNRFDLAILAMVSGRNPEETLKQLWEAIREGLVVPVDESYKLVAMGETHAPFRFLHDRVQQGTYALLDEGERRRNHLRIGRLLLEHTREEDLDDEILTVAQHFNLATDLLDAEEKLRIARLNYRAGLRAKDSSAYDAARQFFRQGLALLPSAPWQQEYDLTRSLSMERGTAEYLLLDFDEAERCFDEVIQHAATLLDKIQGYEAKLLLSRNQNKLTESLRIGLEALHLLGFPMPEHPDMQTVQAEAANVFQQLGERTILELEHLPDITNPRQLAIGRILTECIISAHHGSPEFLPIFALKSINFHLEHGNSLYAAFAYAFYAVVLISGFGDIENGYAFGQLGQAVQQQYRSKKFHTKVALAFAVFGMHWKQHLRETLPILENAYQNCLETGDSEMLSYTLNHILAHQFFEGKPLKEMQEIAAQYYPLMRKSVVKDAFQFYSMYYQTILTLAGDWLSSNALQGDIFDETEIVPQWQAAHAVAVLSEYTVCKILLCYLHGDYAEAVRYARERDCTMTIGGHATSREYAFFYPLALLAQYDDNGEADREDLLATVAKFSEQMREWAEHCPENCRHRALLLQAEHHRISGRTADAMPLYEHAVKLAGKHGFLRDEAIAGECAAKFYLAKGMDKVARVYMQDARYAYQRWGYIAKAQRLTEQYPHWFGQPVRTVSESVSAEGVSVTTTMTTGADATRLDVETMIKASQTLSREVRLDQVLRRLMRLVVENAGAQKGVLLLKEEEQWHIQAQISPENEVLVLQGIPLNILVGDPSRPLSVAIVEYTIRTGESVVLPNALRDERFGHGNYVQRTQLRSVLCQPITHKGAVTGILYLENNLSVNTFTPDRLELLNILCAQAAISLENARLVENIREQERLQKEMELARQIQTAILPKRIEHPDFEIEAVMLPAEEVGGDYYDGLIGKDGNLWLGIGDVSGHGVTPGLIMMMAQTIHTTITTQTDVTPREVIIGLNDVLYRDVRERLNADHFMTFTTLRHLREGRFQYAGAHLTMLLYRQARGVCEEIDTEGAFLNFIPDISHAVRNAEFTMELGDTLVLYTDGLTEAHKPGGAILDIQRFTDIVQRHASKSAEAMRDAIMDDVLVWSEQSRLDDMSLMIVRRTC